MDNFLQSPVTTNTQRNIANIPNERQISSYSLAETRKIFKLLINQSTINDYKYYDLEENDAESDLNRNPKVSTHTSNRKKRKVTDTDTTNRNYPHKLLINRINPEITSVVIPPIYPLTVDGVAASGGNLHVRRTIISMEIVTNMARSAAQIFQRS